MSYTAETKNYGQIEDRIYIRDESVGYDFSDQSPVTFLTFNGMGSATSVARYLIFWKSFFYKRLGHHVNVMNIRDSGTQFGHFTGNLLGIDGICSDTHGLSNFINEKIYLKNGSTKRTVVFADCAGASPAVLTSRIVPYHSLNLTTPYLRIYGREHQFDTPEYSAWVTNTEADWVRTELSHLDQWFDLTGYLDAFVSNPSVQLNLHWATNITGIDLMFRNLVKDIGRHSNVTITDHVIPPEIEAHMLQTYLIESRKFFNLVMTEIRTQFASLGIETKQRVCNSIG